jgi:hypothetical protein
MAATERAIEFANLTAGKRWLAFYRALRLEAPERFFDLWKLEKALTRAREGQYGDRGLLAAFIRPDLTYHYGGPYMGPLAALLRWYARRLGVDPAAKGFIAATLATAEAALWHFDWDATGRIALGEWRLNSVEDDADLLLSKAQELLNEYLNVVEIALQGTAGMALPQPPCLPPYALGAGITRKEYYRIVLQIAAYYTAAVERAYADKADRLTPADAKRRQDHYRWLVRRLQGKSAGQITEDLNTRAVLDESKDLYAEAVLDKSTVAKAVSQTAAELGIVLQPLPRGRPQVTS